MPCTKGKVERAIHYLDDNFLNGRCFDDLEDLNALCLHWCELTANVRILILDEIGYLALGYLALDRTQASLLFQVMPNRYESHGPIILTSNKAFGDWAQVFANDPIMGSAYLDRLLHRSTILNVRGEFFRLKKMPSRLKLDAPSNS